MSVLLRRNFVVGSAVSAYVLFVGSTTATFFYCNSLPKIDNNNHFKPYAYSYDGMDGCDYVADPKHFMPTHYLDKDGEYLGFCYQYRE